MEGVPENSKLSAPSNTGTFRSLYLTATASVEGKELLTLVVFGILGTRPPSLSGGAGTKRVFIVSTHPNALVPL
jgi:hypothetical protein